MMLCPFINLSKCIDRDTKIDLESSKFELFAFIDVYGNSFYDCTFRAVVKKKSEIKNTHDWYLFGEGTCTKISP